ncbi:hypothetical protein, partial [Ralstonia sp.]|uniref:hypothetical protein n=1 Tax=Ralstonia sp. TaxID=54061 RepID=UPI0025EDDA0A
ERARAGAQRALKPLAHVLLPKMFLCVDWLDSSDALAAAKAVCKLRGSIAGAVRRAVNGR